MDTFRTFVYDGGDCGGRKEDRRGGDKVELELGLSLNGRFGVHRRYVTENNNGDNNNRLIRASSVEFFSSSQSATEDPFALSLNLPLTRTCSLPIQTEEWKKRKELQSFRRSEAKRKRVEKLKTGRVVKSSTTAESFTNVNESSPSLLPRLPKPPSFPSPVSIESPASGGSSGVSDLESQPVSGTNKEAESENTTGRHPIPISRSNSVASASPIVNRRDETLKTLFADMPSVSTKGDKKIDGFLYRYKTGEDVRIVCVCHGSFLTPAEFVRHGGGGDVEHPHRHIIVNPPPI